MERKNDFAISILSRFEVEKNTSKRYDFLMMILDDIEKEIKQPTDTKQPEPTE